MILFSAQIRAARGMLKMSQAELADETGLSVPTIKSLEGSDEAIEKSHMSTIKKIKENYEKRGIKFTFSKDSDGMQIAEFGLKMSAKKPENN